jgi:hypothetical protein
MGGAVNGAVLTVERCTFVRNEAGSQGGGAQLAANSLLRLSTFVGNRAPVGSALYTSNVDRSWEVQTSVFALNLDGPAVDALLPQSAAEGDCNVFWQNFAGDYARYLSGPNDQFVDPEFCNVPADDYTVRDTSPCAEKNSPVCGQIGAYGIGCGTVSVEATSWSRVKSWYREEE